MDISGANVEPYRRYHDFHEQLNVSLKVLTAAAHHTIECLEVPTADLKLGDLIRAAHPLWRSPPIWEHDPGLAQSMISAIATLGIVSVWSALDDFRVGIEAEIERWKSFSGCKVQLNDVHNSGEPQEPIFALLSRLGWRQEQQNNVLDVMHYFDLVRNCIAHRNGRASNALSLYSSSSQLRDAYQSLENRPDESLPTFRPDDPIALHPTQAIFYSHLGRIMTTAANAQLLSILGIDGFLNMAVSHISALQIPRAMSPRSAEAALNILLYYRYRVKLDGGSDASRRLKELGLWIRFTKNYEQFLFDTGRRSP